MTYRLFVPVLLNLALLAGCTPERKFQPGTDYPEWAHDKPEYREPAKEPVPFIEGTNGRPDVYYSSQRLVFIKRPRTPDPRKVPRPAVFTTTDNGQNWKKEGHFGLEQKYFSLLAPKDGSYGICVIGAHSNLALANLQIQQIQVVDATTPQVQLSISPEEEPYWIGQRIELSWNIVDPHLTQTPAKLYSKVVTPGVATRWELVKADLPSSGAYTVTVERLPSTAKALILRVEATDQMGNIGVGHTPALEMLRFRPDLTPTEGATTTVVIPEPEPPEEPAVAPVPDELPVEPEMLPPLESETPVEEPAAPTGSVVPTADQDVARAQPKEHTSDVELAQAKPRTEMDELESLLSGMSGPVFKGKVHQTPQPERAPAVDVAVAKPVRKTSDKPIVAKASPAEVATAEPVVDKGTAEEPGLLVPPMVDKGAAVPTEPIVTVKPPAEPTTKSPTEPSTIITLKPITPSKQPQQPAPLVATLSLSHGKYRMAKPWERLGNRAAAARDFYKYAPSLSNY